VLDSSTRSSKYTWCERLSKYRRRMTYRYKSATCLSQSDILVQRTGLHLAACFFWRDEATHAIDSCVSSPDTQQLVSWNSSLHALPIFFRFMGFGMGVSLRLFEAFVPVLSLYALLRSGASSPLESDVALLYKSAISSASPS